MKTTITMTVDAEIKDKALSIIQNKYNTNLSTLVNSILNDIVKSPKKWLEYYQEYESKK